MRNLIIFIAIIMVGFAVLLFIGGLFADPVLALFQPIFCPADSTISAVRTTYSRPGETSTTVDFYCTDREGRITDVSAQANLAMFGSFLLGTFVVPFALSAGSRRRKLAAMRDTAGSGDDLGDDQIQAIDGGYRMKSGGGGSGTGGDDDEGLVEKLEELQQALDAGLITQTEFDRKRQQIIDSF